MLALGRHADAACGPGGIRLVSFQLDRPNGTDAGQGMSLLANTTIAITKVPADPASARGVVRIVRASQGRPFGDTEVRLNSVEPGGLGRRPHWWMRSRRSSAKNRG